MNSLFKPYLPVDGEGFVTIDNIDDVLNMEYSLTNLSRCIRKSEERATSSTSGQVGEVIVLTDDEPEPEPEPDYDSFSNPGTSSMASSHQDDMSSDFDWHSVSSIYGARSSTSQNVIETVSIDSPSSLTRKSSSDSFSDFDFGMDEASTTAETSTTAKQKEEHTISMETAINDKAKPKLNGDTSENLSTLDESLFNRLVKDINSTHLSLPSNGSISSDVDIMQNGNQSQTDEDDNEQNNMETNGNDDILSNNSKNQVPVVCDVVDNFNKGTVNSEFTEVHPIVNGETELIDGERSNQQAAIEIAATCNLNADENLNENCDNEVNTILKGHEETLKNIDEIILSVDLKQPTAIPSGSGSSIENPIQNVQIVPQKTFVDTACSPLIFDDEEEAEEEEKENDSEEEEVVIEPVVESIVEEISVNEPIGEVQNEILVGFTCEIVDTPAPEPTEECSKEPLTMFIDEPQELVETLEVSDPFETVNEPPIRIAIDDNNEQTIETVIINDLPFEMDGIEVVVAKEPKDWVPAAESTVSVLTETSLLTKSEQEIVFKDRESGEMFSELFINGPPPIKDAVEKPSEDTLSQISSDSPLTFLVNGLDPNFKMKTYSRKNRKPQIDKKTISTQTISTQTCSPPQSASVSPVTTIDDSMKTDKEILIDDDEQFLSDIFNSTDPQVGTGNISKVHSPKTYLASTPAPKLLRTYGAKRPATQLTPPVKCMTPKTEGVVYTIKPIEKPADESRKFEKFEPSPFAAAIQNPESATETPPVVVKRKRGRPRKYPLPTPSTTDIQQPAVEQPKKEPKKRGRKPKPKDPLPSTSSIESLVEPKVLRPRRIRAKRISILQDVLNIKSPKLRRLTMSRRFSKVLSLADTPKLATILRRLTYNKSINSSRSFTNKNCNSTLSSSSVLYSSAYRMNGQKKASDSLATNKETTVQTNEPKETNDSSMFSTPSIPPTLPRRRRPTIFERPTILERKNYLKSNQTSSPMSSALKFSPHSAKHNHSSPQRIRQINRIQRYSRIDLITNHVRRRDRKKSVKNTNPRVLIRRIDLNTFRNLNVSEISKPMVENRTETNATDVNTNDVQNSTALVVDLTDDDEMQLSLFGPSVNSTQETSDFNSMHSNKRTSYDTETDMTNEFTTDQESNVEDGDDSTRKSKRSRKRPKILDL